jgi:N-acetyl-anhydromuramyl-L-alanine amidase AmpD
MTLTPPGGPRPALAHVVAHLRRWWHVHLIAATAIALAVAFAAGVFSGAAYETVFGVRLNKDAQRIYARVAGNGLEVGQRREREQLPAAQAARVAAINNRVPTLKPETLAAPQPASVTHLVRNYSLRQPGAKPLLWVAHDTESPNAPGLADDLAIVAWFNNPASQASANYVTDADGNTVLMVPTTKKAWHVAFFNSWAIGDELIGYATQRTWPDAQLRAAAQLAAHDVKRYGIPIQHGQVSGCTILRPGIVEHADLGGCGGGHHDPGTSFPIARFIQLVKQYAAGGPAKPTVKPAWYRAAARLAPMWAWFSWRDHRHPAALRPPNVPKRVPASWWPRYAVHVGL